MRANWDQLTDESQLRLSAAALRYAATIIAEQAELIALEMDEGRLEDRGGPDALRLFAAIVRLNNREAEMAVGHA